MIFGSGVAGACTIALILFVWAFVAAADDLNKQRRQRKREMRKENDRPVLNSVLGTIIAVKALEALDRGKKADGTVHRVKDEI